jgi:PAS domain S-box-containing protein/diguanylate cyclase (GGDEF)-like protein
MTAPPPVHLPHPDLLDILPDAVVVVDAHGAIAYVNPALRTLLGWSSEDVVGRPLSVLVPPAARERHERMVERYRVAGQATMMGSRPVLHALHKSGPPVPVSISLCNLFLEGGRQVSVAVLHGVASLHTPLDHATRLAQTDSLTGIGNRLGLSRRTQALITGARPLALLRIRVGGLAPLAARGDAEAAEAALRIVAQRLQAALRAGDLATRISGAEFALVLDSVHDAAALRALAARCAERVSSPLRAAAEFGAGAPRLVAWIGGALHPRHGHSEAELFAAAGRALDRAGASAADPLAGGGGFQLAEED